MKPVRSNTHRENIKLESKRGHVVCLSLRRPWCLLIRLTEAAWTDLEKSEVGVWGTSEGGIQVKIRNVEHQYLNRSKNLEPVRNNL